MLVVVLGNPGVGKTYFSKILEKYYSFKHIEGDNYLTSEMKKNIQDKKPFTQGMRNDFCNELIEKIKSIQQEAQNIVLSQALPKNINRKQFKNSFPNVTFVHIKTANEIADKRIEDRNIDSAIPLTKEFVTITRQQTFEELDLELDAKVIINDEDNSFRNIRKQIKELLALEPHKNLLGKRILITAGPTVEKIDPVRYLSNHSTGIIDYKLAEIFADNGADVILISGPVHIKPPDGLYKFISVESSQEMYTQVMSNIIGIDAFISAAAPADFKPIQFSPIKINFTTNEIVIKLRKTTDILAAVARLENKPLTIGFVTETDTLLEHAKNKLLQKSVDLICVHQANISVDFNKPNIQMSLINTDGSIINLGKKSIHEQVQTILITVDQLLIKREFHMRDRNITLVRDINHHRKNLLTLEHKVINAIGDHVNITHIIKKECLVRDEENEHLNFYIYNPKSLSNNPAKKATLFYIPGTGWVGRNIDIEHLICSRLARDTGAQIIVPEYRLSPEFKAPIPLQDCYDVLLYIMSKSDEFNIDLNNLFLGGYSCGGAMAVQIAIISKFDNINIKKIFLMSPSFDLSRSIKDFQNEQNEDKIIKEPFLEWRRDKYVPKGVAFDDPRVSPYFLSQDLLSRLPAMVLFFGNHDVVRGDCELFTKKLQGYNVNVEKIMFNGEHCSFWYESEPIKLFSTKIRENFELDHLNQQAKQITYFDHKNKTVYIVGLSLVGLGLFGLWRSKNNAVVNYNSINSSLNLILNPKRNPLSKR